MESIHDIFKYEVLIKEQYLDSFGHMNNAAYLVLFEDARWDFITRNGYGLEYIKQHQKGPVVLEANLQFKKEIFLREIITIVSTSRDVIRDRIMTLEQHMLKPDGTIAAKLMLTVGFFDLKLRTLIPPEQHWLDAVGFKKR